MSEPNSSEVARDLKAEAESLAAAAGWPANSIGCHKIYRALFLAHRSGMRKAAEIVREQEAEARAEAAQYERESDDESRHAAHMEAMALDDVAAAIESAAALAEAHP